MPDDLALTMPAPTDTLDITGPALSATSDMPSIETPAEPIAETPDAKEPEAEAGEAAAEETPAEGVEGETGEEVEEVAAEPVAEKKPDPRTAAIKALREQNEALQADLRRALALADAVAGKKPEEATPELQKPAVTETQALRPRRENFDDPDAYDAAMSDYNIAEAERRFEAKQQAKTDEGAQERAQAEAKEVATTLVNSWQEKKAALAETHPDFAEIAEGDHVTINETMGQTLLLLERGPEVAYWLGQHPEEAAKIAAATTFVQGNVGRNVQALSRAGALLGKIEALLPTNTPTPARKPAPKVSQVPEPIKPLIGNNASADAFDPETASGDDYADRRLPHYREQRRPGARAMN